MLELKHARKAYGDLRRLRRRSTCTSSAAIASRSSAPTASGKSTLMRMLSGEEAPDAGERIEGHNVVMQYFAQDEATRLDPAPTVYETLASGSPLHMVPAIRNILGGFLFSGDDVYKRVRVLSGGERTRLAVARMLLRPSNTLLLDEPTNHLDLDSKEVLLDALVDYGGTLIFVSHDRYFVERLATKIIEVGDGTALVYPGHLHASSCGTRNIGAGRAPDRQDGRSGARATATGSASVERASQARRAAERRQNGRSPAQPRRARARPTTATASREEKKRADAEARKRARAPTGAPAREIDDARSPDRRDRSGDPRDRADDGGARLLRRPRRRPAGHRPPPGADVAGRRPDAPVGRAPVRRPTSPTA